ncbi:hypothetical protein IW148_005267 [Coemansia sp. RSA 1199]|nr:hypothetical protein IW148_005267 [Coemansia sp. RSA 1199]
MSKELQVLDWATQYFCSLDDHEILCDLLPLRQWEVGSTVVYHAHPREKRRRPHMSTPTTTRMRELNDGQFDGDSQPLHAVFYRLRKALSELGPAYLGLSESEDVLDKQQPWASPLDLQPWASPVDPQEPSVDLQPWASPFNSPQPVEDVAEATDAAEATDNTNNTDNTHNTDAAQAQQVDIPEMIYLLITAETARRHFAASTLRLKHTQGPLASQSERWHHRFAKRNIALETKFENILVALKELVVLRAIADPRSTQIGELRRVMGYTQPSHTESAALALSVLNLMFPVDPVHTKSLNGSKWLVRYAFTLQHVPSPRMQLLQLLCETEAWVSGDDRVTASVATHVNDGSDPADSVDPADSDLHRTKRICIAEPRTPRTCPTWVAAARGLAWSRLKQSCHTYVRDTQQNIADQHRALHPWVPVDTAARAETPVSKDIDASENCDTSENSDTPKDFDIHGRAGQRSAQAFMAESNHLFDQVMNQLPPTATVVERIALHAKLMNMSFSKDAAYKLLAQPQ